VYTILLYYKYIDINDPAKLAADQRVLCEKLTLKGRIIVATEGINSTVEGTEDNINGYIEEMKKDERFTDIHFKKSRGTQDGTAFPKLSIKVRSEIVSSYIDRPVKARGKRLPPDELHKWINDGRDFVIVDMRNDYEHRSGHFRGSILPPLSNFRDLKKIVSTLEPLKNKTVLSVCTGGVRCEKASGYLIEEGFKDVYQLDGGIVSYMEKYPGQDFLGSLYVFDGRVVMKSTDIESIAKNGPDVINKIKHTIVGQCVHCSEPCESYINCVVSGCHIHIISCGNCQVSKNMKCVECVAKGH
jgi:UPF0176 protein